MKVSEEKSIMDGKSLLNIAKELSEKGFTDKLGSGEKAINVALGSQVQFHDGSRALRREKLKSQFTESLKLINPDDVEVDFDSLSVSGQTVNAKIKIERLIDVCNKLDNQKINIYPNNLEQVHNS
ncbi:hypothetical protein [Reichenbachiella sp.]|uniref:hypothetical protein n=1 Tax=Reichenbachiella sp. TaxID=2184521 RepID=UPI003BB1743C